LYTSMTNNNEQKIRNCWQEIYKYIQSRVRSSFDAEDLTQETFVRALRAQATTGEELGSEIAFLKTIARNLVIDKYRKDSRHPVLFLESALPTPDPAERPEQHYERLEFVDEVRASFRKLHIHQQSVLECRLLLDLSIKETAEHLRIAEGNVKSLQFRGVRKVREQLGGSQ